MTAALLFNVALMLAGYLVINVWGVGEPRVLRAARRVEGEMRRAGLDTGWDKLCAQNLAPLAYEPGDSHRVILFPACPSTPPTHSNPTTSQESRQ